ncbi:MAG: hypothetical protein CVU62_05730 [Deltaproteobacteria bacterium HGW-Deltaproteobacteria-2]|nr:MAG: hypothetical protein CVU62_05730 [Deltaproteobacteria bacterium HGW-Deltaproteobacteria-2]
MKIAWFSHTAETNGAELSMLEACKGLIERGHQISAILPWTGPLVNLLENIGAVIYISPYLFWTCSRKPYPSLIQRVRRAASNYLSGRRLKDVLLQIAPDVAVTNTITIPSGALAAHWAGIPHIWYIHEFGEEDHGFDYYFGKNYTFGFIRNYSDRIIVDSDAVFKKFCPFIGKDKLCKIYYAVDIPKSNYREETKGVQTGTINLIQVGRIIESKKPDDAIRALGILVRKDLDVRLTFLGSASLDYKTKLEIIIAEENLTDKITFLPFTENPAALIRKADVLLMCSRNEAFGRVTVEAMKQGLPVVGARSGGTIELIKDGWSGFLYTPDNHEDLAQKIETIYQQRTLLKQMGDNAHTWANEKFTMGKYVSDLETVFGEVINNECMQNEMN